jgi:phosphotransferase system HPr (HPr) family protein
LIRKKCSTGKILGARAKIEPNPAAACRRIVMKRSTVVVPWREGLHLRPAAKLVRLSKRFHSTVLLKCRGKVADMHSILSIVSLCATMGTTLDIETNGDDEHDAARAIEQVFSAHGAGDASGSVTERNL